MAMTSCLQAGLLPFPLSWLRPFFCPLQSEQTKTAYSLDLVLLHPFLTPWLPPFEVATLFVRWPFLSPLSAVFLTFVN